MITEYHHDDDLPPEMRALSEQLRQRALGMGCECRPGITVDTMKQVILLEHLPTCPAWRHPSANAHEN